MFASAVTLAPVTLAPLPPAAPRPAPRKRAIAGFAHGTMVRTVWGPRAVETLMAGDLLLDAKGQIVELRGLRRRRAAAGDLVQVDPSALGLGMAPGDMTRPLVVGAAQKLAIRDWRTEILFGKPALTAARALVDDTNVRPVAGKGRMLVVLEFDSPTVILANGLNALVGESA